MALITCVDCKKEFSNDAKRCPHCGARKRSSRIMRRVVVAIILIFIVAKYQGNRIIKDAEKRAATAKAERIQAGLLPPVEPEPAKNPWRVNEDQSAMDDSKNVYLSKDAEGPISAWLKKPTPTLFVRCLEGKTNVFIIMGTAAQPEYGRYREATIEIRIDDAKVYKERWGESTDNEALFAPNSIPLARKLSKAKKALFRFVPFNSPPATAEFDLTGLDEVLSKVSDTCKWPAS